MKDKFFANGNNQGLARNPFVHAVFMHLYQTTKGLHAKADAARVVAMLDELFDQIGENEFIHTRYRYESSTLFTTKNIPSIRAFFVLPLYHSLHRAETHPQTKRISNSNRNVGYRNYCR